VAPYNYTNGFHMLHQGKHAVMATVYPDSDWLAAQSGAEF
jgi:hypothetical protein